MVNDFDKLISFLNYKRETNPSVSYYRELYPMVKDMKKGYEREIKNLRLQSDTYFEEWQNEKKGINQFLDNLENRSKTTPELKEAIILAKELGLYK